MTREPFPAEIRVLIGASFVIAIGFGLISPVLPAYARSFDVGVAAASVIVSSFAAFRLAFAPAGGALVSRLGERPVYLVGVLIVALSSFATAFADSYAELLAYRSLGGIGSTLFTVSAMSLLVRLAPAAMRGRVTSAYASSFLLGGIAGPVLGGLLAGHGMRLPFVVYGLALLLAAALVALRIPAASLRPSADAPALPRMGVREAWAHRTFRAAMASGLANGWTSFGVRVAIVPQIAVVIRNEPWVAGTALAISAVGTAAGLQGAGRWSDRYGRRPLALLGLSVLGLATAALGFAADQGLVPFLALNAVAGLGAGLLSPGQQAAVADIVGAERSGGPVLAAFQMAQDLGAIIGPVLIGVIADRFGWEVAFAATGALCLLALLPWLRAPETHAPTARPGLSTT